MNSIVVDGVAVVVAAAAAVVVDFCHCNLAA